MSTLKRSTLAGLLASVFAGPVLAIMPPVPDSTVLNTQAASNPASFAISATGTPVITSTITVANVAGVLWDLDVTTTIAHAATDDLQITLTSPAGTVVTLAANPFNEATSAITYADIYNGTLWDDQANPGGQVPYPTNAGNGNDHPYTSGQLASPITPHEPLSAFRGENPNGTWTLTIADRFDELGGSLNGWGFTLGYVSPFPGVAVLTGSNSTPQVISAAGTPTVSSTIALSGPPGRIVNVEVTTQIPHTNSADLDVTLRSPSGTLVTLTSDSGAIWNDVFNGTTFRDDADPDGVAPYSEGITSVGQNSNMTGDHPYDGNGVVTPLTPEEALGAFTGEDPNGTWTLTVSDDRDLGTIGGGSLNGWSLRVEYGQALGPVGPPAPFTIPTLGWLGMLALAVLLGLVALRTHARG